MCEKENIFKNKVDFNPRGSNFALHLGTQEILGSYCNIFSIFKALCKWCHTGHFAGLPLVHKDS